MSIPSLSWGILGTGSIARKFAGELPHSRTGRLVAVGSRSQESAEVFARQFPGLRAHGSYEALLADPEVQAVYISTPHPQHCEWAVAAAEAGKHILCEKPIGLNHAEAMIVAEAARRHGVLLMEAFMYRCHPRTAKIAELIGSGVIGAVKTMRVTFSFNAGYRPESRLFSNALGGGGILDVGCYTASIARLVAGAAVGRPFEDPVEVTGCASFCETGVDAVAIASLKFPSGILAQLATGVSVTQEADLMVYGELGWLKVASFWNPPGPIEIYNFQTKETVIVESDPGIYKYAMEADAVAEALPALETKQVSVADTLGNMLTLDRWRAAAKLEYECERLDSPSHSRGSGRVSLRRNRWPEIPSATLPGLDKPMSRLVMGVDNQRTIAHMEAMADDFFSRGGNAFDTAFIYGGGLMERVLGRWIANRGVRDEVVVLAKGAHTPFCDPKSLREQLLTSLERLGVDYADLYLMHRDNPDIPVGEFVDVLDEFRREGKIKAYGGSNWSLERLREANAYAAKTGREPFRVVSNNLSLARMVQPVWDGCRSAKGEEWRRWLGETGMALLAWSSQARGYFVPQRSEDREMLRSWDSEDNRERRRRANELAAKYEVSPINIALAFVLSQPFTSLALVGPRVIEETRTTTPGATLKLAPREVAWLDLEAGASL